MLVGLLSKMQKHKDMLLMCFRLPLLFDSTVVAFMFHVSCFINIYLKCWLLFMLKVVGYRIHSCFPTAFSFYKAQTHLLSGCVGMLDTETTTIHCLCPTSYCFSLAIFRSGSRILLLDLVVPNYFLLGLESCPRCLLSRNFFF